jgi:hypothetical protein
MPATATCTPTSRSTPTTTPCCKPPTRRWRASCAWQESLGGVISGEHGIGITKLEFLSDKALSEFAAYKNKVDPDGRFNKGKLLPGADLGNAYTPSFGLLELESLIMEQSEIGAIADSIKDCLRCGKCKPVCNTHVPRANLLYSPRNKILATSLLIEAFLYEEQTRRGVSLAHFDEFDDVATTARSATSAKIPARWTSISATSPPPCATSCVPGKKKASRRPGWP